ncbi:MAG: hypothetical protein LLG04_14790 [Parachlamydia sp.]|nr:hypothetical protein [Parachlamydia sp.]
MIYITGPNDTLGDPATQQEFLDLINQPSFYLFNPHLTPYKLKSPLPPYTPMLLSKDSPDLKEVVTELNLLPPEDRMCLWQLQESGIDAPTLMATNDVMCEIQKYSQKVRKFIDDPLITTPWISSDPFLTRSSVFDIAPGLFGLISGSLSRHKYIGPLDELYDAVVRRDILNMELARMLRLKGKNLPLLRLVQAEIEVQSKIIKKLLPKRVHDTLLANYLNKRGVDVHKLRGNWYSAKMAGKGKSATLGLEFLSKTNLNQFKGLIKGLIILGKIAEYTSFGLGAGAVLFDTYQAWQQKKDFTRAFVSGAAGFGAGLYLGSLGSTSALGACAISTLAGDAALGGLLVASFPVIGTVVVIVVGAAALGYVSYQASKAVETAWDSKMGKDIREVITKSAENFYEKMKKAWNDSEPWIIKFYGYPYPYD